MSVYLWKGLSWQQMRGSVKPDRTNTEFRFVTEKLELFYDDGDCQVFKNLLFQSCLLLLKRSPWDERRHFILRFSQFSVQNVLQEKADLLLVYSKNLPARTHARTHTHTRTKSKVTDLVLEDWCIMGPPDHKGFWIIFRLCGLVLINTSGPAAD